MAFEFDGPCHNVNIIITIIIIICFLKNKTNLYFMAFYLFTFSIETRNNDVLGYHSVFLVLLIFFLTTV